MSITRILFWIFLLISSATARVSIDYSDGGYTNVVVGIHPQIPESEIELFLGELKVLFQSASKLLKEATKGLVYFREIVFALPKIYHNTLKHHNLEYNNEYFRNPDVLITRNDVFQRAYAVQNEGCGKPGLRIHIPDQFVLKSRNNKGKDFVRAWAKYRYGVFDESGFVGDELYPACFVIPGTNITKVTDCTNKRSSYDLREIKVKNSNQCNPVPKYGRNVDITSSIMTNMDFPNNKYFCDDEQHKHNKDAPSKQNALCREQSTWKVISKHNDFQQSRKSSSSREIKFKYVMETDYKLIFAVSSSKEMNLSARLDMTRNAFAYFLLNYLPENSTIGLTNLKETDDIESSLILPVKSQSDAERLIDVFPELEEDAVCVHCGIEKAIKILRKYSEIPQGDIVIVTEKDIEKNIYQEFTNNFVKLHVIYFQREIEKPPLLQELSANTGGKFFYIAENYKVVSSLTQIHESFRAIYESISWMNMNQVLVNQETFFPGDCSGCSMNFYVDESIKSLQILITGPDFSKTLPVVKNKITLSNRYQNLTLRDSSFSHKSKIPAYVFDIQDPQPGKWTVSFQRKLGTINPIVVIIRGFTPKFKDIATVKTWIKYDFYDEEKEVKQPPISIYAEVKKGNFAVTNTSVSAILYEVKSGKQLSLPLLDNGEGDPDITKSDGIFSRYFINGLKAGYYMLTTKIEASSFDNDSKKHDEGSISNYCCGSSYPKTALYDFPQLNRLVTFGSFFVYDRSIGVVLPPRRINDLRFEKLVLLENGITCFSLKWTAPGDNYDYGTAKEYQLRVFKLKEDAQKNFDHASVLNLTEWSTHGSILTPHSSGAAENAVVELKNLTSGIYFLALRSVGFTGKLSKVSNVIEIYFAQPTISPFLSTPTDDTKTGMPFIDKSAGIDPVLPVSITIGILIILVIIGIGILVYTRAKRRKQDSDESPSDAQKTSNDAKYDGKGEQNISVISPVNSWPADSLLSHYESQRDKKPDVCNVPMVRRDTEDTISTVSSKYSYSTKYHVNPSFYDSSYFPNHERNDITYPLNPGYGQFNPTHTSSLRRFHHQGVINEFSPTIITYSSSFDGTPGYKLRTDV